MFSRESKGKADSDISASDAQEQAVDKEFQKYLAENLISIDDNPLKWWKSNQFCFPILAKVAKQFLSISATSVPCERLFSTSGNIITPKQASLEPNTANMLFFFGTKFAREVIHIKLDC